MQNQPEKWWSKVSSSQKHIDDIRQNLHRAVRQRLIFQNVQQFENEAQILHQTQVVLLFTGLCQEFVEVFVQGSLKVSWSVVPNLKQVWILGHQFQILRCCFQCRVNTPLVFQFLRNIVKTSASCVNGAWDKAVALQVIGRSN